MTRYSNVLKKKQKKKIKYDKQHRNYTYIYNRAKLFNTILKHLIGKSLVDNTNPSQMKIAQFKIQN